MRKIKILNIYNIQEDEKLENFDGIIELIPYKNTGYYSLEKKIKKDLKFDSKFDNIYLVISKENTPMQNKYKDILEELEQATSNTLLYIKNPNKKVFSETKNSKRRRFSFGKYIVKDGKGGYIILDSFLCNPLLSENTFEYVDIKTGKVYTDEIFENNFGYPLSKLTSNDILNSDFFTKNSDIIYDLLKRHFDKKNQGKENKKVILEKILKKD